MASFDELLERADVPSRAVLRRVIGAVRAAGPDLVEGTSYGMAAFLHRGRPVVGLSVSARHLSLHPFSPAVVALVAGELGGHSLSKGTIRFTADRPLPDEVVGRIVELRMAEIDGG